MAPPSEPGVLARMADLLGETPAEQGGAVWRLAGPGRQLDANVVRLAPGADVGAHAEPDLDVLLYVTDGGGRLDIDGGRHTLGPGSLTWLPRGTSRSLSAGPDGMVYLTVHRRRPGLRIRSAAPEHEPQREPRRQIEPQLEGGPQPKGGPQPEGGEAACLLHRVCPDCGRLAPERDALYCSRCGTRLPSE
ncbi:cupin domain-containing protein [Streptomyces jeddahensis]|uniref:Cupin domain protein n=1 Tax=Streptomyces jeddahensis TaxID=1716141 RepID=A0A177HN19_9ACTN|nr:cupin domain-containing protein [Streptomyces jeddahensis]OAH12273.1 cupin domain protein [Streptomyces jeddahensis]